MTAPGRCRLSGAGKPQCGRCESANERYCRSADRLVSRLRQHLARRLSRRPWPSGFSHTCAPTTIKPQPYPGPALDLGPGTGAWSPTIQSCGADGVACGTACTATSRASSGCGLLLSGCSDHIGNGDQRGVGGRACSSTSRQRSHADWRVTPSWTAISDQDLRCRRAIRTACSSACSNARRTVPMSDSAISARSPSPGPSG